jgi:phosphoglycerate dehydrogenase-like enzyme
MHPDHTAPFEIGVTRDLRRPDGSLALAPFTLDALDREDVSWHFLAEDARPLTSELLRDLDGLYHFSVPLTAASLDGVERLAIVARNGVGLDFIDLDACTQHGIAVTITPGGVTRPMASAAVTLVLALAHRLPQRDRALHAGAWSDGRFEPTALGLTGRTLGLIGYGRIGREIARLLAPWEMRTIVSVRSSSVDDPAVTRLELDELLAESDVVVIACPLTEETRGLLDGRRLALMKPGALLVNIARGAIVDQEALADALRSGHLGGAGLDVFDPEPFPAEHPLLALPNVIGAPHSLGYSDELIRGCIAGACQALLEVAAGRTPPDIANPDVLDSPLWQDKLHRYAAMHDHMRRST